MAISSMLFVRLISWGFFRMKYIFWLYISPQVNYAQHTNNDLNLKKTFNIWFCSHDIRTHTRIHVCFEYIRFIPRRLRSKLRKKKLRRKRKSNKKPVFACPSKQQKENIERKKWRKKKRMKKYSDGTPNERNQRQHTQREPTNELRRYVYSHSQHGWSQG